MNEDCFHIREEAGLQSFDNVLPFTKESYEDWACMIEYSQFYFHQSSPFVKMREVYMWTIIQHFWKNI
jgi:hypothetical protein